jgi:hypothetical protein
MVQQTKNLLLELKDAAQQIRKSRAARGQVLAQRFRQLRGSLAKEVAKEVMYLRQSRRLDL